jgi:RNA polymerase sigma-70 factor (ECF subfamily)
MSQVLAIGAQAVNSPSYLATQDPGPAMPGRDPPAPQQGGGIPDEFTGFFRRHYPRVLAHVMIAGGDRGEAEDIAQDAFMALYRNWGRLKDEDHRLAYVFKTARYRAYDHWSLARREVPFGDIPGHESPVTQPVPSADLIDLRAAIRQLPPAQAQTAALLINDCSAQEIGKHLGVTPATARSNIRHARKKLAKLLSEAGADDIRASEAGQDGEHNQDRTLPWLCHR